MEQFQPNILQFLQERFRPQVSGFPSQPCFPFAFPQLHSYMQLPVPAHTSVCSSTISPTSLPVKSPLPIGAPFRFSQADVDVALYGYTNSKDSMTSRHAVSGIRSGDLSYGIDRILSTDKKDVKKPPSPPMEQQAINMTKQELSSAIDPKYDVTNHVTHDFAKHVTRDVEFPPALALSCNRGLNYEGLDMPNGLTIRKTLFGNMVHYGVFCKKAVISKGTRFGPFKGRVINTSEIKSSDDNSLMWEIFRDGKLSHFIDGRRNAGNWMAFVNCARYAQEQNLIALQSEGDVFYEVCKDIPKDTELLVWYGDSYLQFMGVPVALKELTGNEAREEADASEGYQCERCGKVFAYRYYRDKHLKYTRCVDQGDRKFPCHLCTRSFEKRDRLRIHILHVHEKHRPHKCLVCNKSFSQSSSLNKHMRVHSGERPYKCVYCNKAFTASSILRTHIRQHSGEKPFKCRHCGKAFASHAAHDSHVRRTHARDKICACSVCGKTFTQGYELKVHMSSHTRQQT